MGSEGARPGSTSRSAGYELRRRRPRAATARRVPRRRSAARSRTASRRAAAITTSVREFAPPGGRRRTPTRAAGATRGVAVQAGPRRVGLLPGAGRGELAAAASRRRAACSGAVGRAATSSINQVRWKDASPSWNGAGKSLRDYRNLVVNHETGHWLGHGHLGCPGPGRLAPVMMQQSERADNPGRSRAGRLRIRDGRAVRDRRLCSGREARTSSPRLATSRSCASSSSLPGTAGGRAGRGTRLPTSPLRTGWRAAYVGRRGGAGSRVRRVEVVEVRRRPARPRPARGTGCGSRRTRWRCRVVGALAAVVGGDHQQRVLAERWGRASMVASSLPSWRSVWLTALRYCGDMPAVARGRRVGRERCRKREGPLRGGQVGDQALSPAGRCRRMSRAVDRRGQERWYSENFVLVAKSARARARRRASAEKTEPTGCPAAAWTVLRLQPVVVPGDAVAAAGRGRCGGWSPCSCGWAA